MEVLSKEMTLSSRIRFMLLDVLEMRDSGWRERRKKDGPKTIDQVSNYCVFTFFPFPLVWISGLHASISVIGNCFFLAFKPFNHWKP
jgi:hypothetical protein